MSPRKHAELPPHRCSARVDIPGRFGRRWWSSPLCAWSLHQVLFGVYFNNASFWFLARQHAGGNCHMIRKNGVA